MIAIDWSHTKELTTFDGKKLRTETVKQLCKRVTTHCSDDGAGGESTIKVQSIGSVQPPSVIIEQGCPMSLAYKLILAGAGVFTIENKATEEYRQKHGIEKSDEADARIIYELANTGAVLAPLTLNDKMMNIHDIYHQYIKYQKARVAMQNMKKAHMRSYRGWGESKERVQSRQSLHPQPDLMPYDIAIETLGAREKTLLKRLESTIKGLPLFEHHDFRVSADMAGGESKQLIQSKSCVHPPAIKGLGQRLWLGIIVTASPQNFKCLSAYLRFCGLTDDVGKSHKYNRHARSLYRLLAEEVMKQRDPKFRPLYDKFKAQIKAKYPDYTKGHCHNAALNRVATFLAKAIYKAGESTKLL